MNPLFFTLDGKLLIWVGRFSLLSFFIIDADDSSRTTEKVSGKIEK